MINHKTENYDLDKLMYERIELIIGDICNANTDAIVTPTSFKDMSKAKGGVNLAIHNAAGPDLQKELEELWIHKGFTYCTRGYNLNCKAIIHAAVPEFSNTWQWLYGCYSSSIYECYLRGYASVAFPSLGTGHNGFPKDVAAKIALQSIQEYIYHYPKRNVRFKMYFTNIDTLNAYYKELNDRLKENKNVKCMQDNESPEMLHIPELEL